MADSSLLKSSTTKEIYHIIDNLENRLTNRVRYNSRDNFNYSRPYYNNINLIKSNQMNPNQLNNMNFRAQPPEFQMQPGPLNEYNIRKIIKDEFSSLIIPYQQDLHNNLNILETKINDNTNRIKDLNSKNIDGINNIINRGGLNNYFSGNEQPIIDNNQYVLRVEYDNKIVELEHQITTINSYSKSLKNNVDSDKIEMNKKINDISKLYNNHNIMDNNEKYLDKKDFDEKIREIQNQFDKIYDEMNQFQNKLNQLSKENKLNENKINNINEEIKRIESNINNNMNNINDDLNT